MKRLLLILIIFTVLISCSDKEPFNLKSDNFNIANITKQEIENASLKQKLEYKRHHMKVLASWIATKSDQIIALNTQNQNIFKSNDSDYKYFFVEDLLQDLVVNNKNDYRTTQDFENVKASLEAFKNLEGVSWYPMIFIKKESNFSFSKSNLEELTYIALEDADENGESFTAYEVLDNDEIIEVQEPFTEEFVGNNELLVVELIACNDEYLMQYKSSNKISSCISIDSGGGGGTGGTSNALSLKLEKMKIKDLKEGWPGRPEIGFKGYKVSNINSIAYDCNEFIHASVDCWGNLAGQRIGRIKRSWENDERTYNFAIKTDDNNSDDIIYYIIFEQDSWPAPWKQELFPFASGLNSRIPYRSWQDIYDKQILSQNQNNPYNYKYANNFSTENSTIKYNLKLK